MSAVQEPMSHNTFGHMFRITTFGESHGPAIGCVIDGCPAGLPVSEAAIQTALDARKPGGDLVSQRQEADTCRILSGVFEGKTLGSPIAIVIENTDARAKDYDALRHVFRPGHADYVTHAKYGHRDHRGGGRASARETACRVAAGAVARIVLGADIAITAQLVQMGTLAITPEVDWQTELAAIRKAGDSVGGIVAVAAHGVPVGWGAPVYGKLDADIAAALMSIPAAKGVEIGDGFASATQRGSVAHDEMTVFNGQPQFTSNHAGGILGGISTGQAITARVAFKPTSSIAIPRATITDAGAATTVSVGGRHDPCVAIRAVPVVEAMMACVLADHMLRHRSVRP